MSKKKKSVRVRRCVWMPEVGFHNGSNGFVSACEPTWWSASAATMFVFCPSCGRPVELILDGKAV